MSSNAWETTTDDVQIVLNKMGRKATEEQVNKIHGSLDHEEIERSALMGNDLETQTDYAHEEIRRQIDCLNTWENLK